MGGRPVRVSAEPDGLLNGINASGFGESRGEKDGDAKKAVPAVPTAVHGGFRVGMLMFRGLMSENCLDGTLRLIRGSHPLGSRLEQIEGRCNKTHKRGNGIGSGDPTPRLFKGAKISWNGKNECIDDDSPSPQQPDDRTWRERNWKKRGNREPTRKGENPQLDLFPACSIQGSPRGVWGLSMSPLDTIGRR